MTPRGSLCLLGVALAALTPAAWGQKASPWRGYRVADGLAESACFSVTVSAQGKVVVRHANAASVSELDGYTVTSFTTPEIRDSRVYGSPGGQLWSVTLEGLEEHRDEGWVVHPVPQIAAQLRARSPRPIDPVPLLPVRQGLVLMLLTDSLLQYNCEDVAHPRTEVLRTAGQTALGSFSGMGPARDGGLWISGARGLAKVEAPLRSLKPESKWREFVPPENLGVQNLQEPHESPEGVVVAVAESVPTQQKVVVQLEADHWSILPAGAEKIRHAWYGPDQTGWAATIDTLFQWGKGRPDLAESEEISARRYFDAAVEPSGAFWLATSDGLFRYTSLCWRLPEAVRALGAPVHCLAADAQDRLWFVAGNALHALQNDQHTPYPFPRALIRRLQATRALFPLKDGAVVLDVEEPDGGDRFFRFDPPTSAFSPIAPGTPGGTFKMLGFLKDGSLCVQRLRPAAAGPESPGELEVCDGRNFEPFPDPPPPEVSIGSRFSILFVAQSGDLWLSGSRGSAWYHDKKWRAFVSTDKTTPEEVQGFIELPDGKIWGATTDRIWEFDGRNWVIIRRGFDRLNAMLRARDGSVWVASNSGLHRWYQGAWVENGVEEGLASASIRALCEDPHGRLWAGTTRGLSLYHPDADLDPPRTQIQTLKDSEKNIPEGAVLTLTFSGRDKWNVTPRDRLLYSYRLDERDWSPFAELNSVPLPDLSAGKHYFQVRAMDRNCNVDPRPDQLEFSVILPWYKETRLVLITIAGAATAIFFAALAFNRHRQLLRSYAEVERKVADRTRELEWANRELLHSQKMTALGTLSAGIAHDFNNILSIIKGSAQIIEDNLENPRKVRIRVDRIKTVVEQGAGIVKAMLGFSRDSEAQPARCALNTVVEDTIKLLGDRFLHEVQVRFEPAPDLPEIACARDFVQQILLNFLFNSADAMTERKEVIIATRHLAKAPESLILTPSQTPAYVAVSVRDFGCGIPAENIPRIFEPFFTTKGLSARRGTGLGLSMAYELAKKMAAGLAVESAVGEGSTFTLILPVTEPAAEPA